MFFTTADATPDATGRAVIDHAADWARQYSEAPIAVTGYALPGPAESALAYRRARAVAGLLRQDGVAPARIRVGVSTDQTLATGGLPNRRVEVAIGR